MGRIMIDPNIKKIETNIDLEPVSFDNWDIKTYGKGTSHPFIVVDNWYLPYEEKAIWAEIEFYLRNPFIQKSADKNDSSVATYKDKTSKAKNTRIFLTELYKNHSTSHINNCLYKQRSPEFKEVLKENCLPYYRTFHESNAEHTMLSFYTNEDHYDTHYDSSAWTCLIWMVNSKLSFEGGDFEFPEINHRIELKNNRMVMFPGCFNHKVYPLKFNNKSKSGFGKYTITHFYLHIPKDFL